MAKVGNSIFDIQGKLGDLVYYRYRGKSFVRKAPSKRKNNPSSLQLEQRAKFKLMTNFHQPLTDFLKITYKVYNRNKTGYQKAFSENYHNALKGAHPSYSIDYSKVKLAKGSLQNASDLTLHSPEPGKLILSWPENDNCWGSLNSDLLWVAVYNEKLNQWIYEFKCAERYKHFFRMDLTPFSGVRVQVYIGFVSADGKQVSHSYYAGELMVS
jgi:hypothetical protein